jgi:ferredoxin-NADP reductase
MKIKFLKKKEESGNIKSFIFEKPNGFNFDPGQFIYLTLPKLLFPDQRGEIRHFTISSSPTEDILMITTKIREESGYKKTLDKIEEGSFLEYQGPIGDFVLKKNKEKVQVFLAGGIGITPFRSIIKYKIDKNLKTKIDLIYSCSTTEEITFRNELEIWNKNGQINLDITITHPEESKEKWDGLKGRLDRNVIEDIIKNYNIENIDFWVCGPPPFVSAMEEELSGMGINNESIITEKFSGY